MPRKEPLYFKKSKAAKQLDYDFYTESESFLGKLEGDPGRVKPQKTKEQYKYNRTNDFPYYEDQHNESRSHKYNEDIYFDSDYTYDVGDKYLGYVNEYSSDPSDTGSILEEQYHRQKKDRKKRQSENVVYNNQKKDKERNNFRKQRRPPKSNEESRIIRNNKDFNVYISQRPITLQYESQDDLIEPLESVTQRRRKSKKHKGFKIPTSESKPPGDYEIYMADVKNIPTNKVFGQHQQGESLQTHSTPTDPHNLTSQPNLKELATNISNSIAQSVLRLFYLPVYLMSNNEVSQSSGGLQPALFFNSANKHPNGTDQVIGSQNLMSVFTAHNNDQNNIFEQKIKSVNKEREDLAPNQRTLEEISKGRLSDAHQKKKLKKKLYASPLGAAMTADSYASLIASHPEQMSTLGALPSLIKVCKELKKKKGATAQNELEFGQDENGRQKKDSTIKPDSGIKEMSVANTHSTEDHVTKQENKKQKSERKNSRMNDKSVAGEVNNKKRTSNEGKTLPQMKSEDLEQVDEGKNIIINIKENSFTSKVLPNASQPQEKEINLEIRGTESRNFMDGQQAVGDYNINLSRNQSNTGKKPSSVSKTHSWVSQGAMITGNYKKVGHNQSGMNSLRSFAIPEGERSFVTSQKSDNGKKDFELKENNCKRTIDSANVHKPKAMAQIEGSKTSLPKQGDDQIIFEAHDKGFTREISLNELKAISEPNIQNDEEKELLHNPKSILKKDHLNNISPGINDREERGMNHYNNNNREENIRKSQEKKDILTKSTLNTAQATEQHPKKHLSVSGGKDQEVDALGKAFQSSLEELYEEDVEQHLQTQPNLSYQSVHQQHSEHFLTESLKENPSLEIIHPPPEKGSTEQSTNNILFLQSEEPDEPLNYHPSKLYEYTEAILIVSFQTAQYISGVSFYDKLINIIDFFYYEDD